MIWGKAVEITKCADRFVAAWGQDVVREKPDRASCCAKVEVHFSISVSISISVSLAVARLLGGDITPHQKHVNTFFQKKFTALKLFFFTSVTRLPWRIKPR